MNQARENPACLVFCPLYHRDQSMGYTAMNLGNGTGAALYPVLMLLNGEGIEIPKPVWYEVFVTYMGENGQAAFALVQQLRQDGIRADLDHCGRSLKAQFKYANKTGAPITAVIGEEEAANGAVKLKRMSDGEEKTVAVADVCEAVRELGGFPIAP